MKTMRGRSPRRSCGRKACATRNGPERVDIEKIENAVEIHVQRGLALRPIGAGVGDENVDGFAHLRGGGARRGFVARVENEDAACLSSRREHFFQLLAARSHARGHLLAARDELSDEFEPDAPAGAGDQPMRHERKLRFQSCRI